MNLQFSPVLRKNVIQENKIQMSIDDLTWALKHKYWVLFLSFLNVKVMIFLKNTALLPIIVCYACHCIYLNLGMINRLSSGWEIRYGLGCLTCLFWLCRRLNLYANKYVKTELIMVKISINKDELYWREICERKELNSVESILYFWKDSNVREP